jgi:hypothetical protein
MLVPKHLTRSGTTTKKGNIKSFKETKEVCSRQEVLPISAKWIWMHFNQQSLVKMEGSHW